MIEGIPVGDGANPRPSGKFTASVSKARILTIAFSLTAIMLLVSLQGWIFDEVVDGINDEREGYERVPVWERSDWPYITNQSYSYVMEYGEYTVLETENDWNSTHHFVNFALPLSDGGSAPNGVVSLAVWLPDVPDGVTVPVIAEFGPYFDETIRNNM